MWGDWGTNFLKENHEMTISNHFLKSRLFFWDYSMRNYRFL